MTEKNKNIFYILLFLSMLAWGGSWVNVKVLSAYINEFETMFLRFFITALTMIPIIIILNKSFRIDLKSLALVIITSIAFILYMKYFFLGTKYGTASLGGAFVTTLIPINTFLILALLGTKKIVRKDAFALFIGAIGVMTMLHVWSFDIEKIFTIHNLYFILASILWPVVTILSSKSTKISPVVFTFYLYVSTSIINILFFVDITKLPYEHFDYIYWLNIFFLTIFASTFANTVYFLGIEKLGAREVSSFIFFVPFAAIVLSAIFLKEKIDFSIILGTLLTIIAITILNNIKIFKKKKISSEQTA
ncbi:EamA family transporter [Halarcobacter ebronensis]|uniref:EamA family transporter n=1 Tax=Halarcobacter ebronensis TaxID=1462615 RepID=A0A4Q0YDQ3_9BACT|nr:DMT family transporter [Halarcobacter ebronensis]RXJ67694.1 EamA family transporter [Halarcobacter ebronensis]